MKKVIRNRDIAHVLLGVPEGHKHMRICLELKDGTILVFQEATIANILRAYVHIKTHPTVRARELLLNALESKRKEGYAVYQLLETTKSDEEVEKQLTEIVQKIERLT